MAVSEELDVLWKLRDLDERVIASSAALTRFPEQHRDIDQRLASERAHLEQVKLRLHDLQLKRRDLEREVGVFSDQERRFQSQLQSVKKNEEYTALLHEISAAKQKRSDLETEVLLQLEAEEIEQQERPKIERALSAMEREAGDRKAALEAEEAEERARLAALEKEREDQLVHLAPATRSRYERVRSSRDGRAVVPILKAACGGCFRGQPPQVLQEARRRERLLTCEGCGRLLLWPPE